MTRSLVLGTAGHIDHGKTALVHALTGIDTDRLPEEKARGVTIDIGFAHLDTTHGSLAIIDVPGHERFIRNMLAGASGIDLALLVIAADDSVMPQTHEHLAILQLLGIRHGVIVMTKCDLADPDWQDLVEEDIRELTRTTFLREAPIVRTSATTGSGIDDLRQAIQECCVTIQQSHRDDETDRPFRLAVDRSFTAAGLGTIITGTVWSGSVTVDTELEHLPTRRRVRIRGMQVHGQDARTITVGQRAAINLSGVHHSEIERGHELAEPGSLTPAHRITGHLHVLPDSPFPIKHRSRVRLHIGTAELIAQVRLLSGMTIEAGHAQTASLVTTEPVVCMARQPFVVRCESPLITLGGGTVLQPSVHIPAIARGDDQGIRLLQSILDDEPAARVATAVRLRGYSRWQESDLWREADVTPNQARLALTQLQQEGTLVSLPVSKGRAALLHADRCQELKLRVLKAIRFLHDRSPLAAAIPRTQIIGRLSYLDSDLIQALLSHMITDRQLTGNEHTVARADHKPALTPEQVQALNTLLATYESAAFTPPAVEQAAQSLGTSPDRLKPLFDLAAQQNQLIHIGAFLYLHHSREREARQRLADAFDSSPQGLTISEIRVLLNTSRKYAVPICEYFDRLGVTKRLGDKRMAGPNLRHEEG